MTPNHSGPSIQFIQQRIANRKFFHITDATMHGMRNNIITLRKNLGKHQLQMACHWLALMPSMPRLQFIQLRIANRKFFHITNVTMPGTRSNIITPLRNRGRLQRQMACHSPELTLSWPRIQFTQPKTVNLKSFLITNVIMPGTPSNTITLLRNRGRHRHQMACHWPVLMLSMQNRSIQLRIANLRLFHTTNAIMPGTQSSITTHPRNHGKNQHQMECLWLAPMLSLNPSKKKDNCNSCRFRKHSTATELKPTRRLSHT